MGQQDETKKSLGPARKGAVYKRGKGGPPVLEKLARHHPCQGRGWLDHLYAQTYGQSLGSLDTHTLLSSEE